MLTRLREFVAAINDARWLRCSVLQQHEDVRKVDGHRLRLECLRCGRTTIGIETGPGAPVLVPASFVGIDQQRATRQRDLARLQARWRLRERA